MIFSWEERRASSNIRAQNTLDVTIIVALPRSPTNREEKLPLWSVRSYFPLACSMAVMIFCNLESESTSPSPFFLECTNLPFTSTSNQPEVEGVATPVISSSFGNTPSSNVLSLANLGWYPHPPLKDDKQTYLNNIHLIGQNAICMLTMFLWPITVS